VWDSVGQKREVKRGLSMMFLEKIMMLLQTTLPHKCAHGRSVDLKIQTLTRSHGDAVPITPSYTLAPLQLSLSL
jgi:hypothetical protein